MHDMIVVRDAVCFLIYLFVSIRGIYLCPLASLRVCRFIMVQESHQLVRAPPAITNAVNWRAEGIVHKKNEIFLDVIEKLNLLVSSNGTVLHSEILGSLKMKSFLSGMPELKLGLNDKVLLESRGLATKGKAVEMEDVRFHQCVRLARFENDRTISFIPPDGEFELMSYRLATQVRPLIWIEAHVEPHTHSRIEYFIKAKSNFKRRSTANNVEIIIPVPSDADSPTFKVCGCYFVLFVRANFFQSVHVCHLCHCFSSCVACSVCIRMVAADFDRHRPILSRKGLRRVVNQAVRRPERVLYARALWPAIRFVRGRLDRHQGADQRAL